METDDGLDPADEGRVIEHDGASVLRFERGLAPPPAEVWAALTAPDLTARWSFRTEFEPRAGGALTFDFGEAGSASGEVIAWEEPRLLEYAWDGMGGRWHLRIGLAETAHGTSLTLDHLAPDPHDPDFAAGWHWHLDRLALLLDGGAPAPVATDAHFEELQRLYSHAGG